MPDGSGGYIVTEIPNCRFAGFSTYGDGCPGNGPAHFEFFDNGAGETTDLDGLAVRYQNVGAGRYLILPTGSAWETNFGAALSLADDSFSGPQPLGFAADLCGVTGATDVDICSNGYVVIGAAPGAADYSASVSEFLDQDPRIAVFWQDLDPSAAGTVYFNALPGKAVVTYDQVQEHANAGSANTCQLQIFSDGSFTIEWQTVAALANDAIVGMSGGNDRTDPGEDDMSALAASITQGSSTGPVTLSSTGVPAIGAPFKLDIGNLPANSVAGFMVLGYTRQFPGASLAPLGMPGCRQFLALDDSFPFSVTPGAATASFTLNIPAGTRFIGFGAFVQAAILVPGINQLGLVASNGGYMAVGQ